MGSLDTISLGFGWSIMMHLNNNIKDKIKVVEKFISQKYEVECKIESI